MEDRNTVRICEQCGEEKPDVEKVYVLEPPGWEIYLCKTCQSEVVTKRAEPKTESIRKWRDWQWKLLMASAQHRSRILGMPVKKRDMVEVAEEIKHVQQELQFLNQKLARIVDLLEVLVRSGGNNES